MSPAPKKRNPPSPSIKGLEAGLLEAQIELDPPALNQLWQFHQYLRKRNVELNMTRIHNFENMVRKHYVDCLLVVQLMHHNGLKLRGPVLDLGSGPGFPGIPLAIACPETEFILAEGRHKRVEFLQDCVELLGLKNVSVYGGRVHADLGLGAATVITRAVESMAHTMRHCMGNTTGQALFVFMKGPNCVEEIQELQTQNRYQLVLDKAYTLPDSTDHRRLVIWHDQMIQEHQEIITSSANKSFKQLKGLLGSKGIRKQAQCLVAGEKIIAEQLSSKAATDCQLIAAPHHRDLQLLGQSGAIPVQIYSKSLFDELDIFGTDYPLLLLPVPAITEWQPEQSMDLPAVILPLQNPENLGAAIRSARAFGYQSIVLTSESAHPYHPKTIRASAGYSLDASYLNASSLENFLSSIQSEVVALDSSGVDIRQIQIPPEHVLLVGQEGPGLPSHIQLKCISIPLAEGVDSLNATVAISIAMYTLTKQS